MATTFPGGVTSNVVGSTYQYQSPQDQAAAYNLQKQMQEDKQRALDKAFLANANLGKPPRDPQAEADARQKAAYEKFYGPIMQSQWDRERGQIGGVPPQRATASAGMNPQNYPMYMKADPFGMRTGRMGYEYKPDTNMPALDYQKQLDQAYEMWKAGQMMGAKDWETHSYLGTSYGGRGKEGNVAGASF